MAEQVDDPGLTFDEALTLVAGTMTAAEADSRFHNDAILDAAREKLRKVASVYQRDHPEAADEFEARLQMRRRLSEQPD